MKTIVGVSVQMIFASLQSGQEEGHERTVRKNWKQVPEHN